MNTAPAAGLLTAAVAAILATAGCATGSPEPTASSVASTPASLRPTVPPPVPRPLDASGYGGARICELLTNDQAMRLGSFDDTPTPHSIGKDFHECTRDQSGTRSPSAIITYKSDLAESFLDYLYETSRDFYEFTPLTISGQPAVRYWLNDGYTPSRLCRVAVGLAERQSVKVEVSAQRDACDLAVAVAEQIVHNLGG